MKVIKVLAPIILFAASACAQQLDPSFGSGGLVLTPFPYPNPSPFSSSSSAGFAGFLRSNGGLTFLGKQTYTFPKSPGYTADRTVTYASNGANTGFGATTLNLKVRDAAQQADDQVVGVGTTDEQLGQNYPTGNWFVERFSPLAALDPTFDQDGVLVLDFGTANEQANNVAVQPDGKIIVSGFAAANGGLSIIVRLNPDGTPDPTFGPSGNGTVLLFDTGILSEKMLLKPDGKILLAGKYYDNPTNPAETVSMYFQLNADGSPDNTFGKNGLAYSFDSWKVTFADIKAYPGGKVLVLANRSYTPQGSVGFTERDIVLTQLNPDGTLDLAFGQDGKVFANTSPPFSQATDFSYSLYGSEAAQTMAVESTGNIVVAMVSGKAAPIRSGFVSSGTFPGEYQRRSVLLLHRYNGVGKLIARNFAGQTPVDQVASSVGTVTDLIEQPDHRLLAFGTIDPNSFDPAHYNQARPHVLVARFTGIGAVENANNFYDYNLNGLADFVTYAPVAGNFSKWMVVRFSNSFNGPQFFPLAMDFGLEGDTPVPGDYDGDGVQDLAVFRNSIGDWFTRKIYTNNCAPMDCTEQVHFGLPGDVPAPGDFDGDGATDRAVFRPSEGNWYILFSSGGYTGLHFGQNGDMPVTGDYDDDGRSDVAVIRRENGLMTWYILQSSNNQFVGLQFGLTEDKAVPADYTGDGKTDICVWRPDEGNWYFLSNYTDFSAAHWGMIGDLPAPADHDGDHISDMTVFRPSDRTFYSFLSHFGTQVAYTVEAPANVPIPGAYVR